MRKSGLITTLMFIGLLLGVAFGVIIHDDLDTAFANAGVLTKPVYRALLWVQTTLGIEPVAKSGQFTYDWLHSLGTIILVRPLMLIVVPLVFLSVVLGVTSIGDPAKLGLVSGATLLYFLLTMLMAAVLGAASVSILKPGDLPPEQGAALISHATDELQAGDVAANIERFKRDNKSSLPGAWSDLVNQIIPTNLVREMGEGRTLGLIVFAVFFGLALAAGGATTEPALRTFSAFFDAAMRIVGWIMWLLPIGLFLLVSHAIGKTGLSVLAGPLSKFILLALGALLVHALFVLPVILAITARANPIRFGWNCRKALLTAFGTSSSTATLPVALKVCTSDAGCSMRATNLVVPLGAAINMNGTAIFQTVAVIFLCQLHGIDLEMTELIIVVITATIASIGAAGIPTAGLVTMVMIIIALNVSLEGRSVAPLPETSIAVLIAVDRILDMFRTTVNVWGNMVGARIMTQLAPDAVVDQAVTKSTT